MAPYSLISIKDIRRLRVAAGAAFTVRSRNEAHILKALGLARDATPEAPAPPVAVPAAPPPVTQDAPSAEPAVDVPAEASADEPVAPEEPSTPDEPAPAAHVPSPPVPGPMRARRYLRKDLTPGK